MDTHNLICDFGRHRGERYTRLPVSYLKWLANTPGHRAQAIAVAELERRGTTTPELDVSGHAIDRASLTCRKLWHQTRAGDEGLHAWLCRMAAEALAHGTPSGDKTEYGGMLFAFDREGTWPVLKTVMPAKHRADGDSIPDDRKPS